ncbi:hypothetical protein HYDPIDRAFT_109810 [Hydnomerulius pinastri MD-312]|nr:hypothetical protein HYDPIDRAFT_109810 [Hydnomerulius pinastri MD-312]
MPVCVGCQKMYSPAGYSRHLAQTTNPACAEIYAAFQNYLPHANGKEGDPDGDDEPIPFEGDFFGSYDDEPDIFPWPNTPEREGAPDLGAVPSPPSSTALAGPSLEGGWEPPVLDIPEGDVEEGDGLGDDESYASPTSATSQTVRQDTERPLQKGPYITHFPVPTAGQPIVTQNGAQTQFESYESYFKEDPANVYSPFTSSMEWKFVRWAKLRGPSSTAVSDLLEIEGVHERLGLSFKNSQELNKIIDKGLPAQRPRFHRKEVVVAGEALDFYMRNIMECAAALFGDPEFAKDLIFLPERHYADEDQTQRLYHDLHTGKWWWQTQKSVEERTPGATIVPILLSSDKTQVTLFRNKAAYPIYMTIGNLPKDIRRKPSRGAQILVGYLPTAKLEHITNKSARRRTMTNVFHTCMQELLQPLKKAGLHGVPMRSGDGILRRAHPLVACYIGDYPEQLLVTGVKTGECPGCDIPRGELGSADTASKFRDLKSILDALGLVDDDPLNFTKACANAGIKPIYRPFWEDLPYCNIYRAITPDVLHQLYQGLIKHLISWIKLAYGEAEIDARCKRLPPNHNVRVFMKGISGLSRVSGTEHDQICRFLLGIVIDIRLPGGASSARLVRAIRGLLDFLYLAQYPCHSDETLSLLDDALNQFHDNKQIFVDLGIRSTFELPKLHSLRHYVYMIQRFGTTDNYSTQYTERLHIDLAKDAYRATNHKDEYIQMTAWLERREKVLYHENFIRWRLGDTSANRQRHRLRLSDMSYIRQYKTAKHPSAKAVTLQTLETTYGATYLRAALARFAVKLAKPELNTRQQEDAAQDINLPRALPIFHKIRFNSVDSSGHCDESQTVDAIHAKPGRKDRQGRGVPARFDTALINLGDGKDTGVKGYRIGQVRAVFSIPQQAQNLIFGHANVSIPQHLAYVEWFTPFAPSPERNHAMYKVQRSIVNRERMGSIVPVVNIRRSVHLIPKFGAVAPREWTSSNVLERCKTFFVNPFTDRHAYRTIF